MKPLCYELRKTPLFSKFETSDDILNSFLSQNKKSEMVSIGRFHRGEKCYEEYKIFTRICYSYYVVTIKIFLGIEEVTGVSFDYTICEGMEII